MTETELETLQILKQINQKLDRLLHEFPGNGELKSLARAPEKSRLECAQEIAAMTPSSIRQTDAVELLREDMSR